MPDLRALRSGHLGRRLSWLALLLSSLLVVAGAFVVRESRPPAGPMLSAAAPTAERARPGVAGRLPPGFTEPVATTPQAAPPVELAIPVVGIRSRLIGLHLNNDGTLQVPQDYAAVGWYSDGSRPGDAGPPAVLVGHVDSVTGPGAFFRLPQVKAGDAVLVRGADGRVLRFVVYASQEFSKKEFPSTEVYASVPTPELRLITCTGVFDRSSGHYESNLVLSARLAAPVKDASHT